MIDRIRAVMTTELKLKYEHGYVILTNKPPELIRGKSYCTSTMHCDLSSAIWTHATGVGLRIFAEFMSQFPGTTITINSMKTPCYGTIIFEQKSLAEFTANTNFEPIYQRQEVIEEDLTRHDITNITITRCDVQQIILKVEDA